MSATTMTKWSSAELA